MPAELLGPEERVLSRLHRQLDALLDGRVEQDGLSFSMLVWRGDETLYERSDGLADPESGRELTSHSAFNLASVTKPFTALCILQLKVQGLLGYDDDARSWLPGLPFEGVTLRHLLSHTSGLPEYFDLYDAQFPADRVFRNRDLLGRLVAPEVLNEAFVPFTLNGGDEVDYGLGWRLDPQEGAAWHRGSWAGSRNYVRYGRGVGPTLVLLSNSSFEKMDALVPALNKTLADA